MNGGGWGGWVESWEIEVVREGREGKGSQVRRCQRWAGDKREDADRNGWLRCGRAAREEGREEQNLEKEPVVLAPAVLDTDSTDGFAANNVPAISARRCWCQIHI